jgi:peptidoglycan/xylan/chitin deacetylase (PgdA/CDA1 family)
MPRGTTVPGHYVSPKRFATQLRLLRRFGYSPIDLREVQTTRESKPIVITFDDGYENFYSNAFPELVRYDVPSTVFLVSNLLGKTNEWDSRNGDVTEDLMTVRQIKDAQQKGVHFGSHTLDHADLNAVEPGEAMRQIAESKLNLERSLGREVTTFCYPYGRKSEAVARMVEEAGYQLACSTERGLNTPSTPKFLLRRTNIRNDTLIPVFIYKLLREARRG